MGKMTTENKNDGKKIYKVMMVFESEEEVYIEASSKAEAEKLAEEGHCDDYSCDYNYVGFRCADISTLELDKERTKQRHDTIRKNAAQRAAKENMKVGDDVLVTTYNNMSSPTKCRITEIREHGAIKTDYFENEINSWNFEMVMKEGASPSSVKEASV